MRSSSKNTLIRLGFLSRRFTRVIGLVLFLCGTVLLPPAAAEVGTPNPIDMIRNAQDYRLLSNLFPQAGPTFDPERDRVMSPADEVDAAVFLSEQFAAQKRILKQQSKSVLHALAI